MKIVISSNSFWNLYNFRLGIIKKLIKDKHNVYLLASDDEYSDYFRKLGCYIHILKMKKNSKSFLSDVYLLKSYLLLLNRIKPNINFFFTIKPNIYGSFASSLLNIKYINTVTGLGTSFLRSGFLKIFIFFLYKIAFLKSLTIFFHNNDDLNIFLKKKIIGSKNSFVIPGSGVNLSDFKFINKLDKEKKIINFIFIGRMIIDKGIEDLLIAANKAVKDFDFIKFHIIGGFDSNNNASISELKFNSLLVKNKIIYLGEKRNINKILNHYDCLILPSYREGCSKAILEAGASGVPVITNNVPGCNNIITDGYNGFLSKPKNTNSLYQCIAKFCLLSYESRLDMSRKMHERIKNNFDEKIVISNYLSQINL